jgi:hypothetical protein
MQMKLKETPNALLRAYMAKSNVWLWGQPGIGKSDTVGVFVEKMKSRIEGFGLYPFYGPTTAPTDVIVGMPNTKTKRLDFFCNSALPNAYEDPNACGVVWFGEAGNTDPATFKLFQKYVNNEDMNGVLRKPKGVIVIADGNRLQDKSGVQQQGRAMMNRFLHLHVYTDASDNTEYAEKHAFHPTIQHFFKYHPTMIDNYSDVFEPNRPQGRAAEDIALATEEGKMGIWACMRGWNRVSDLEYAAESLSTEVSPQEIFGCVGTAVGREYLATRALMGKLKSVDEICRDPEGVDVPSKMDELYGQCLILAMRCTKSQLPAVHKYGDRLPKDMVATMIRRMVVRQQKAGNEDDFAVVGTKTYIKWMEDKQLSDLYMAK